MNADPLTGTVRAEGDAVGGAEVVLFGLAGERPALLCTAVTDADGSFTLRPAERVEGPVAVLARLTGDILGVAAVEAPDPPGKPIVIDVPGPLRTLTVAVERRPGDLAALTVGLEPDAPVTVPAALRPFVNQQAPGVFAGRFAARELAGDELVLRIAPGTWRVSGEFLDENRPNMPDPGFRNVVVTAARSEPGGTPLPGTESGGFVLDVDRDRHIVLALREVPDDEL